MEKPNNEYKLITIIFHLGNIVNAIYTTFLRPLYDLTNGVYIPIYAPTYVGNTLSNSVTYH